MRPARTIFTCCVVIIVSVSVTALLFAQPPHQFETPEKIASLYNNAKVYDALHAYKKMADSADINGYLNMAVIFKDRGHYDLGIRVLQRARRRFGNNSQVLSLLGRLYYLDNQIEAAIHVFDYITSVKADDLDAVIALGLCHEAQGDDAKAQIFFQKAISLNKDNVIARLSLADLYYRQNKLAESAQEYKALSLIDASIQTIYMYWADVLYRIGNNREALKVYEKIIVAEPQNEFVKTRLAAVHTQLGKEYFAQEIARRQQIKEKKMIFVKPLARTKAMAMVRVGIAPVIDSAEFKCSTDFAVATKSNRLSVTQGKAGMAYSLSKSGEKKLILSNDRKENVIIEEPVVLRPVKPEGTITLFDVKYGTANFWSNSEDRSYRGEIEVSAKETGILIVNIVSVEEYLYGVVPAEMPRTWPLEALKAQAVAARSETLAKSGRHRAEGFDLCADVHCQVYSGVEKETQETNLAVDQTRGEVLDYRGKVADAIYSSNCSGHTQDNIYGEISDVPYFKGVSDMTDASAVVFPLSPAALEVWIKDPPRGIYCDIPDYQRGSNFRWVRIYSSAEMRQMVQSVKDVGDVKKILVLKRNPSGHIDRLKIVGTQSDCILEKELAIRKALGNLRSSMFKVEIKYGQNKTPEQFVFYGGGWGHGVGMCQAGACGMAKAGKQYKEILQKYFSATRLKKLY